jgi:hypothetical protein
MYTNSHHSIAALGKITKKQLIAKKSYSRELHRFIRVNDSNSEQGQASSDVVEEVESSEQHEQAVETGDVQSSSNVSESGSGAVALQNDAAITELPQLNRLVSELAQSTSTIPSDALGESDSDNGDVDGDNGPHVLEEYISRRKKRKRNTAVKMDRYRNALALLPSQPCINKDAVDFNFQSVQQYCLVRYFRLLLEGTGKVLASAMVAEEVFSYHIIDNWTHSYKAKLVRNWSDYFLKHHQLYPSQRKRPQLISRISQQGALSVPLPEAAP